LCSQQRTTSKEATAAKAAANIAHTDSTRKLGALKNKNTDRVKDED
jgi:hypothetical protein